MKILFVGTGGIGARHAETVARLRPSAVLVAVRDGHNDTTAALGMNLAPDLGDALADAPDAVVIALPPSMHAEALERTVAAGVPVYVEKPIAMNADEVRPVVARAESANLTTMVGCNLRFLPAFRLIRDAIDGGEIGAVRSAALRCGQWLPDWRPGRDYRETYSAQKALGGGVLRDLIHEIDLARYWFGEFDRVSARAGNSGALDIDCEDHADLLLARGGLTVSVHLDYLDRSPCRQGRIVGETGSLAYDAIAGALTLHPPAPGAARALAKADAFDVPASNHVALAHFLDCVETGAQSRQPLGEGLRSLALADQARAAAQAQGN